MWRVQATCGVEVRGLDLGRATARDVSEVRQRLAEHGVVYFRDAGSSPGEPITPEEHLQFASSLGEVEVNRFFPRVEGYPAIAKVEKTPEMKRAIGSGFHADHTYDLAPAMGSLLVARRVPEQGGDTVFVDMRKAYETLPAEVKAQISGLRAVHSSRHIFGEGGAQAGMMNQASAVQTTAHPVVLVHPASGRKVLFVNPGFTIHLEGQTPEESRPLLATLYQHSVQANHMTRFKYEPGSAVLWDNRSVWHCAMNDYPGQYRLMHRVTIKGVRLPGSEAQLRHGVDVLACSWGETPLDLPFVHHALTTTRSGMRNLDPDMLAWWVNPSLLERAILRTASWVGVDLRSRL